MRWPARIQRGCVSAHTKRPSTCAAVHGAACHAHAGAHLEIAQQRRLLARGAACAGRVVSAVLQPWHVAPHHLRRRLPVTEQRAGGRVGCGRAGQQHQGCSKGSPHHLQLRPATAMAAREPTAATAGSQGPARPIANHTAAPRLCTRRARGVQPGLGPVVRLTFKQQTPSLADRGRSLALRATLSAPLCTNLATRSTRR